MIEKVRIAVLKLYKDTEEPEQYNSLEEYERNHLLQPTEDGYPGIGMAPLG